MSHPDVGLLKRLQRKSGDDSLPEEVVISRSLVSPLHKLTKLLAPPFDFTVRLLFLLSRHRVDVL